MNVISKHAILEFAERHPDASDPLLRWFAAARRASWTNFVEIRRQFPAADFAAPFTVFNIAGNKYRLVTEVVFSKKLVLIRKVMTHAEYDRGAWKR